MKDLDYGFNSQMDYFKVIEEARKHQRDPSKSIDSVHSKLQKSICREDLKKTQKAKKKKKWWKNALLFLKGGSIETHHQGEVAVAGAFRTKVSGGPLYIAHGRSGPSKRNRATRKLSTEPLSGNSAPAETKYELQIPYLNLRDLNVEDEEERRSFTSRTPIYFVT